MPIGSERRKNRWNTDVHFVDILYQILFKQPENGHLGDCPICYLPLSIVVEKSVMMVCCSKQICNGCNDSNQMREEEERLDRRCPFCWQPRTAFTRAEIDRKRMKRIEVNDPVATREMGLQCYYEGDCSGAIEYWTKAPDAELGDAGAHYELSII